MNQKQLEERRAFKAAFRARLTFFAEQRQIPKSEMGLARPAQAGGFSPLRAAPPHRLRMDAHRQPSRLAADRSPLGTVNGHERTHSQARAR
jgi:hypothetical protein